MSGNGSNGASSGGIGFSGLLTIVFITLKLLGVIEWSWIMAMSPMCVEIIVVLLIVLISILSKRRNRK